MSSQINNIQLEYILVFHICRLEICYDVMQRNECFMSSQTCVVITEEYNIMVNCDELNGTTENLTL